LGLKQITSARGRLQSRKKQISCEKTKKSEDTKAYKSVNINIFYLLVFGVFVHLPAAG
jgi:hypothetical protein